MTASILGTSLLTGFPTNTYAEDTLTVLDVNATQNGWSLQDGTWYYYKNGILLTNTWITSGGQYYYLGEDGSMQTNTWIGNYYVDSNGVWLTNYQPAHWFHPEADGGIATKMDLIRLAPGKQSTERSTILTILVYGFWLADH